VCWRWPRGVAAGSTVAALWHMNEPAGSTVMVDSSGNGNNGSLHNVTAGAAGHSGTAYKFGGPKVKSYGEVPDSPSLNPGAARDQYRAQAQHPVAVHFGRL